MIKKGDVFGWLTIVERVANNKRGESVWKCECICGNFKDIKLPNLRGGITKSCGCFPKGNIRQDLCGQKFRKLTITKFLHSDKFRESIYEYQCECGEIGEIRKQCIGRTTACPECREKARGKIIGTHWLSLVNGAKSRGLEFEITKDYAWELFLKQDRKCAISGVEICLVRKVKEYLSGLQTGSIDRIDSSKGYIVGNIQWVHKTVNQLKWDNTTEDLLNWCRIITEYNHEQTHCRSMSD